MFRCRVFRRGGVEEGGCLRRERALLNICSEQKLKWRCTEASGTEFASGEEAFMRSVHDGLYAAFWSRADLEHPGCPEAGSFAVWQHVVQRNSPHQFKPTAHRLHWVIPVGKSSKLGQALHWKTTEFGLWWSDVTDHLFTWYVVATA